MDFLGNIIIEICGAIITGVFVWLIQTFRFWYHLKRHFHNAHFDVFYKGQPDQRKRIIKLTVKGHSIYYIGEHINDLSNEGTFQGELVMNIINLKIGNGFHYHDNYDGYNFPKAFIKDTDTIYVETSYLSNKEQSDKWKFDRIYQAYIFRRNKNSGR